MLSLYTFCGVGLALPATVIVAARSKRKASFLAKKWAEGDKVPVDQLTFVSSKPFDCTPQVVYGWNGDY